MSVFDMIEAMPEPASQYQSVIVGYEAPDGTCHVMVVPCKLLPAPLIAASEMLYSTFEGVTDDGVARLTIPVDSLIDMGVNDDRGDK